MKKLNITLFVLLISSVCVAQSPINKGDSLRKTGKLEDAIKAYKEQYTASPTDWKNTYQLARVYALTFQKDNAFRYLKIALKDDTSLWALADSDLFGLTDDPRWISIENEQMLRYQKHNEPLKNPEYAKKLLSLIIKDQALDYYIDQAKFAYMKEGAIPQWYYPLGAYQQEIIKENYSKMQELVETYGWPKYSKVGTLAADAPLLVINHHEDSSVRKKYLSIIKQSCFDKEGSCMEYAKIQDRILVDDNKEQIYGMQFRYATDRNLEPFPIKDPTYVDQRRSEIGLVPLKQYLKRKINFDWIVEQKTKGE